MSTPMPPRARTARRGLAAAAGLAAVAAGLALVPAPASAVSAGLVISEAYGGGGNSGATYTHDFIELHNPTDAPISVDGLSVQYRSSGGTAAATGVTPLAGEVPAGGYYLIQQAQGAGGTEPLPTPDATGNVSMSGSAFTVWLAEGTAALNPAADGTAVRDGIIDLLGVNSNTFETAKTPGTSNATSAGRIQSDTDNNAADFAIGAPDPQSSGTTQEPEEPGDPVVATIAEIQGTGAVSPLVGELVTTEGVVTAAYPTGGYNGFYLQTPGDPDTPGASDAVFVYGSAATAKVEIGDSVAVTGEVSEWNGTTEITPDAADVTVLEEPLGTVQPLDVPWGELDTEAEKESHEGELVLPQGEFTVSDNYDTNFFASFTLAAGDLPLVQPTEVADAQDTAAIEAVRADNAARMITLDDGASTNFNNAANKSIPLPWLTPDNPVRIGASVTFHQPLVLEFRNNLWNLQPTSQVTGAGTEIVTFENTRTAAPEDVGGDIRLATFNVLNYFPTTGEDYEASGLGTCTYYSDRAGNPITVNRCGTDEAPGPRGAADAVNLQRQQAKIVAAINALDASIVSLEEIENSVKLGKDRDYALATLVDALNDAAGAGTWAYAGSPDPAALPEVAEQDVIRTAFIYKPADVELFGPSVVLTDSPAFADAREPLAQGFKAVGAPDANAFAVIVNHFKSKGSGVDDGTGQGNANPDRIAQAQALSSFADSVAADLGTEAVFLTGDFNSYSQEDPLQELYADGYVNLRSTSDPDETTYSFDGLAGSLDHVLASPAAAQLVTGVDIWNINADEAIAYEYSRYNYNATNLYDDGPFRASDHDPVVVGLDLPDAVAPARVEVDVLPNVAIAKLTPVVVTVRVTAEGARPTGAVTIRWDGGSREVRLVRGYALAVVGPFAKPGRQEIAVDYAGDGTVGAASGSAVVRVIKLW